MAGEKLLNKWRLFDLAASEVTRLVTLNKNATGMDTPVAEKSELIRLA